MFKKIKYTVCMKFFKRINCTKDGNMSKRNSYQK